MLGVNNGTEDAKRTALAVEVLCPQYKGDLTQALAPTPPAPTTTQPTAPSTTAPAPDPEPPVPPATETTSQSNAVRQAQEYLKISAFSRSGLIKQLDSPYGGQFSEADATYAVDSLNVDWNAQAAKAAQEYLKVSSFSHAGLVQQLESPYGGGFTHAQAEYGVSMTGPVTATPCSSLPRTASRSATRHGGRSGYKPCIGPDWTRSTGGVICACTTYGP
jgi:hypothetical protein